MLAPAVRASPVSPYVSVDAGGEPVMHGWLVGPTTFIWKACTEQAGCTTLAQTSESSYEAGPTAPGTWFEVSMDHGSGATDPWRSPVWQGTVVDQGPPAPTGSMVVGTAVGLQAGSWTGGFTGLTTESLYLCAGADGTGCVDFGVGETLKPEHVGHYLIAERQHAGAVRWVPSPFPLGPARPLTRSPAVGPVTPVPSVVPEILQAEPTRSATLRTRAHRAGGRLSVGRVSCTPSCHVTVKVSGGGRKAYTTTFVADGTKAIKVPVRRGKLTVRVRLDGKLLANGRVTAR